LPKGERRPRVQYLFRVRIIDGLPHLCFKDSWNSRRVQYAEVTIPLHQLTEKVHRLICRQHLMTE